jgi:hypothetical protein
MMRLIWSAGPVASSATWSSGARLRANGSSSARLVLTRPAARTPSPSLIATSQKSRWTSRVHFEVEQLIDAGDQVVSRQTTTLRRLGGL